MWPAVRPCSVQLCTRVIEIAGALSDRHSTSCMPVCLFVNDLWLLPWQYQARRAHAGLNKHLIKWTRHKQSKTRQFGWLISALVDFWGFTSARVSICCLCGRYVALVCLCLRLTSSPRHSFSGVAWCGGSWLRSNCMVYIIYVYCPQTTCSQLARSLACASRRVLTEAVNSPFHLCAFEFE